MDDSTERRFKALQRRINREYRQAVKELTAKMEAFTAKYEARDKAKRKQLAEGKITEQEYRNWVKGQVFQGKRWQERIDAAAEQLTRVDEAATDIINDERLDVFADNLNWQNKQAEHAVGVQFNLYDSATVARLLDEQPNLLPPRRVRRSSDIPWYHKQIANAVTQGILQGESIDKIAKRIGETTGERSRAAMLRNARTAMTSAQNAGRIEAMHQQQDMGIAVQKKWIAAHDSRTRKAHLALHGQTVDVDEPFKSMLGEIMFPGDPMANPANVYNCRCALGYVYPEYQPNTIKNQEELRGTQEEIHAEELENRQMTHGVVRPAAQEQVQALKYPNSAKPNTEQNAEQRAPIGIVSYDAFMQSARRHFSDEEYADFQKELVLYIKSMSGDTKKLAAYLDRLDDLKWTDDAPLYRGIGVSDDVYKKLLQEYKPGSEVSMRNISWSTSEASAQQMAQFKGGNQIIFVDESTGKRNMISIEEFTRKNMGDWLANAGHEVLQTKPDEKFIVTQAITNGNLTFVYVKKKASEIGLASASRAYVRNDDHLRHCLSLVKPIEGYEDFGSHGASESIEVETNNGVTQKYSAKQFADILREDPSYNGGSIRLLACETGKTEHGFASELAKTLGVNVMAPTEVLNIADDDKSSKREPGDLFVCDVETIAEMWYYGIDVAEPGKWRLYHPDGTWEEVDKYGHLLHA